MHYFILTQGSCFHPESENSEQPLSTWETEAIGITNSSSLATGDECFLTDRYEVKLPWKEEYTAILDHYQLSVNRLKFLQHPFVENS